MLVGCGIDDNLGMIGFKNPGHGLPAGDGADLHLKIQPVSIGNPQLLLNIIRTILVDIQNDDLLRLHFCQLAAQLRADGTAAAGDEDDLAPVIGIGFFIRNHHGLAEQKLLHIKFPEAAFAPGGLHHGVVVDLDFVARLGIGGVELLLFLVCQMGDGEDHLLHLKGFQTINRGLCFQKNGDSVNLTAGLFCTDINKAPGNIGG